MRRTVIVISLCFLLGIVTSVIVAWGCVLWDPGTRPDTNEFETHGWHGNVEGQWGLLSVHAKRAGGGTPRFYDMSPLGTWDSVSPPSWVDLTDPPVPGSEVYALAAGWPLQCLQYLRWREPKVIRDWDFDEHGVVLGINPLMDRSDRWLDINRLPIAPLWTGMLANSAMYAAAWFAVGLSALPWRWFRSYRMRRRQICLRCGHDQRFSTSSDRCAECGHDPRAKRPMFGMMSIGAMSMAAIVLCSGTIVFAIEFASESPYPRLHYAAYRGDVETVRKELERGADVEALYAHSTFFGLDAHGYTPLTMAAMTGEAETVQVLIDVAADVNADLGSLVSPLAVAIDLDDLRIAKRLIDAGADVDAMWVNPESSGEPPRTVLLFASVSGRLDSLQLLLDNGFDVTTEERSLSTAAARGHTDFVRRMLEHGAPVTHGAMGAALWSCDLELFNLMLESGGDPLSRDESGTLLFDLKGGGDSLEIARMLLDAGVDVNATSSDGLTALMSALWTDVELVRFLLEKGADPSSVGMEDQTALMLAANWRLPEMLLVLLERGADPAELRRSGVEPWSNALDENDAEYRDFIAIMLELGAPVTHSAMAYAVATSDLPLLRLTLDHGGDLSSQSYDGQTLLFDARSEGDGLQICQLLLDAGVDINAADKRKTTALMLAVDDVELVRFLLDNGADMTPANRAVHTAVTLAGRHGTAESLTLLLQRGGNPEDLRNVELWEDDAKQRRAMIDRVLAELDEAKPGGATSEHDDD